EGRIGPLCEPPGRWRVTFEPLDGGLPVDVSVADDGAFVARGLMPGRYVPRLRGLFPTLPSGVCADPSLPLDVPEGVEHLRRDIRVIERPAHVSIRVPGDPEPYRRVGSVEIRTDAGVLLHRGDVWTQDPTRYVVP